METFDIKMDKYGERLLELMKNSNPNLSESELNEAYKFYKYNNLYDEKERQIINLVETRSVGYFQYTSVINDIINYVKKEITENGVLFIPSFKYDLIFLKNGQNVKTQVEYCTIDIPNELVSKIDFFEFLKIKVNITRFISDIPIEDIDDYTFVGTGQHYNDNQYINLNINNKLEGVNIVVNAYMYNDTLFDDKIGETLYHELNHAYQNYMILYRNNIHNYERHGNNPEVVKLIRSYSQEERNIGFLLYRLWDRGEMNAAVESVYGNLCNRKNFGMELQSLKAYQEYSDFKNKTIPSIIYISEETLAKVADILKIKIKNYTTFRKWFMSKSEALNNTFFHKITKAASLAYENQKNK